MGMMKHSKINVFPPAMTFFFISWSRINPIYLILRFFSCQNSSLLCDFCSFFIEKIINFFYSFFCLKVDDTSFRFSFFCIGYSHCCVRSFHFPDQLLIVAAFDSFFPIQMIISFFFSNIDFIWLTSICTEISLGIISKKIFVNAIKSREKISLRGCFLSSNSNDDRNVRGRECRSRCEYISNG